MPDAEAEMLPTDYAEIFRRYSPVIYRYLRGRASSLEETEDLTLEVFTAALANPSLLTWSGPRQLGWLKRVATNKLVDSYRRARRHPVVPLDAFAESLPEECNPEFGVLRREEYAHLSQQIQRLSPLQQDLLRLRYGHGLHTAEIAELLKKSEPSIRQMLSRTLGTLRTLYTLQPTRQGENA